MRPTPAAASGQPRQRPLDLFFHPQTVAVVGATEAPESVGRAVMMNLLMNPFGGVVYPVSPTRSSVVGVKAYPRLADVPRQVELAIVATPAPTVPGVIAECVAAGVKGAVILSAGFRESGPAGMDLERQLVQQERDGLRLLGPSCIGIACPHTGLNATFGPRTVPAGNIGFISQSGSLLAALAGGDPEGRVGCSRFISLGTMLDVSAAECLTYLGDDPQTACVGVYVESIGDPAAFLTAARAVTPRKPVVLLKARRAGAANAATEEALDAALACAGVLRVHTLADLLRMARVLAERRPPGGCRLTIVSNAAGPAVLAADTLLADGGALAPLAPETVAMLDRLLPPHTGRQNPIDAGDDASPERYAKVAGAALQDPNTDAVLAILTPQTTIDPVRAAEHLARLALARARPVLAAWLWGAATPASLEILQRAGIPTFSCADVAVRTFGYLWRHGANLRSLAMAAEASSVPA
jgi:acetyltransferase